MILAYTRSCHSYRNVHNASATIHVASFILVVEMGNRCLMNIVAECKMCKSVYTRYQYRLRVSSLALGMSSN